MLTDPQIKERDGNKCARCGGTKGGLHIHHRWMRSAGTDERACNRVTLCAFCHNFVHMHPGTSIDEGWLCGRYADPAETPVNHKMWPSWPVLLEEGGGIQAVIDDELSRWRSNLSWRSITCYDLLAPADRRPEGR